MTLGLLSISGACCTANDFSVSFQMCFGKCPSLWSPNEEMKIDFREAITGIHQEKHDDRYRLDLGGLNEDKP